MKLEFGCHLGRDICNVRGHLHWLSSLETVIAAANGEHRRCEVDPSPQAHTPTATFLKKYREALKQWHPDDGVGAVGMRATKDAHDRLRKAFRLEGAA